MNALTARDAAEHLARRGLVQPGRRAMAPNSLEQRDHRLDVDFHVVSGSAKRSRHAALPRHVEDLVGPKVADERRQRSAVQEIHLMDDEPPRLTVVEVRQLRGIADDAMHLVALGEQSLRKEVAILPGHAGYHHDPRASIERLTAHGFVARKL